MAYDPFGCPIHHPAMGGDWTGSPWVVTRSSVLRRGANDGAPSGPAAVPLSVSWIQGPQRRPLGPFFGRYDATSDDFPPGCQGWAAVLALVARCWFRSSFFLSGVATTGTGDLHLERYACDLNPPGFDGFRLGGNSFSRTSQPGCCARGGSWYETTRFTAKWGHETSGRPRRRMDGSGGSATPGVGRSGLAGATRPASRFRQEFEENKTL